MARSLKIALARLSIVSALLLLAALPAAATSSSPPSLVSVQLLCAGDCSQLPLVPALPGGGSFDFGRGLKAILDGADLTIMTEGNVFVLGPVNASLSIILSGSDITVLDTRLMAPEITIDGDRVYFPLKVDSPDLITSKPDGPLFWGGVELVAAVTSKESEPAPIPGLTISPSGDVYVDVSMVTLSRFKVKTRGSIVVAGPDSMPVPEPGTALLLGLGLTGLALRGRRDLCGRGDQAGTRIAA